jgi:hypothetical protein
MKKRQRIDGLENVFRRKASKQVYNNDENCSGNEKSRERYADPGSVDHS